MKSPSMRPDAGLSTKGSQTSPAEVARSKLKPPKSAAEAQEHIQCIRGEKGLDGPISTTEDLEEALRVLSKDLYQKSTHFLLELLQNADDNSYKVSTPTMNITLRQRTLRIDCNETGFSKANVEAICRIGKSSKAGSGKESTYIGEKGIGFKSVFKVADVVWINSGHYSFKFDKEEKLGMIAPIWEKFPAKPLSKFTSILLELSQDCELEELILELKALDSKLLLFLHNIREIHVEIFGEEMNTSTASAEQRNHWKTSLLRQDVIGRDNLRQSVILNQDSQLRTYRIFRHQVTHVQAEPKRMGCKQSEMFLAFPSESPVGPDYPTYSVYAFLPVRNYAFKFVLQADFLLTANREDIDSSSSWNNTLLGQIPHAFLNAVKRFNQDNKSRYSWHCYLPIRSDSKDFFQNLQARTIKLLLEEPILESLEGVLVAPSKLLYAPPEFTDCDGRPLIPLGNTDSKYLSNKYSPKNLKENLLLGVRVLSKDLFLDYLNIFIINSQKRFHEMPNKWHSRLAKALAGIVFDNEDNRRTVSAMPIIHLRDGRWICSTTGCLFFPLVHSSLFVPREVNAFEVHPDLEDDQERRQLCTMLGTRRCTADSVCEIILQTHNQSSFRPDNILLEDLISHARFLYEAGYQVAEKQNVWLKTERGPCYLGFQIYMDSRNPYSASEVYAKHRDKILFLHKDYWTACSDLRGWQTWLQDNLGLGSIPRLATHSKPEGSFTLAEDFRFLIENYSSTYVLSILRQHWQLYARWFATDDPRKGDPSKTRETIFRLNSQEALRRTVSTICVSCHGGRTARLEQTYLARDSILIDTSVSIASFDSSNSDSFESSAAIPFLDIPDPNNEQWDYLELFGVVVRLEAGSFINRLQQLKKSRTSTQYVSKLYERLLAFAQASSEDADFIRRAFKADNLVFCPSGHTVDIKSWVTIDSCVWSGPTCLKKISCLEKHYPGLQNFFCDTIGLQNADLKTLVMEAQQTKSSDSLEYMAEVFVTIGHYLAVPNLSSASEDALSLISSKIFPIQNTLSNSGFDYLKSASEADEWYIADRLHLRQSFEGKLDLLAFSQSVISKISALISLLGIEERLLSRKARSTTVVQGAVKIHDIYTTLLREKAKFISRLVPCSKSERELTLKMLRTIEVHQAEKVAVRWFVTSRKSVVRGNAESGRVKLAVEGDKLKLFLTNEDLKNNTPPLELGDELAGFCGITDPSHVVIFSHILIQTDMGRIEEYLQRQGIPDETSPDEHPESYSEFEKDPETIVAAATKTTRGEKNSTVTTSKQEPMSSEPSTPQRLGKTERTDKPENDKIQAKRPAIKEEVLHQGQKLPSRDKVMSKNLRPSSNDTPDFKAQSHSSVERQSMRKQIVETPPQVELTSQYSISKDVGEVEDLIDVSETNDNIQTSHYSQQIQSPSPQIQSQSWVNYAAQRSPPIFEAMSDRILPWSMPVGGGWDKDGARFRGEIYVSKFFERLLGPTYAPNVHWTSDLRSRAGHMPFQRHDMTNSTFTISDTSDRFRAFLISKDYGDAQLLGTGCIYHIEVCVSEGELNSIFYLESTQAKKAENLSVGISRAPPLMEVFVLIRVFDVYTNLGIAMFVDPWKLYLDGLLHFETHSTYFAQLKESAPAVYLREATDLNATVKKTELYTYKRLKSPTDIRLLRITPGSGDKPLEGSIHHGDIHLARSFCAISYVWGVTPASLPPHYFKTSEGNIPITISLHSALKSIRERGLYTFIWADAVCINQEDSLEKTIQIRLLPTIYQAAERVIAWIGNEENDSHRALEMLGNIGRRLDVSKHSTFSDELQQGTLNPPTSERGSQMPPLSSELLVAVDSLLRRSWFRRIWIVQELVLPSKVFIFCGRSESNWEDFFKGLTIYEENLVSEKHSRARSSKYLTHAGPVFALGQTRSRFKVGRRYKLLELLQMFSHTHATEKCDKFFALLGLASDSGRKSFDPDYDSSFEIIVRRYAAEFVANKQAMDLLYRAGISKSYPFCSWIPFWTGEVFPQTISSWEAVEGAFYAGRGTPPSARLQFGSSTTLVVKGFSIDSIINVTKVKIDQGNMVLFVEAIRSLIGWLKNYPTGETREELMLKIPIGNAKRPHLESPQDHMVSYRMSKQAAEEEWPSNLGEIISSINADDNVTNFLDKPVETQQIVMKYWQTASAFATRILDGTFCVTKTGYAGLVPGTARVGDTICVFDGGRVPFVLRKTAPEGQAIWKLIGECYIHGLMHGSALEMYNIFEQDFHLV